MAATKEGTEKLRLRHLQETFGTTDILEILGPAGTIPPTQSISQRLQQFGMSGKHCNRWAKSNIPEELYNQLKPYQKKLGASALIATNLERYGCACALSNSDVQAKRDATNIERYGTTCPILNPQIRARRDVTNLERYGGVSPYSNSAVRQKRDQTNMERYGVLSTLSDPSTLAKIKETNNLRYGGSPAALSPDEILRRLNNQSLKPLEPIFSRSDHHHEIRVRCQLCGHEFTTRLVDNPRYSGRSYKCCECQTHGAKLERFAIEYVREHYYPTAYQWSFIPWLHNREIDIFIPDINIGFEINGYASHNSEVGWLDKGPGKDPLFHKVKSEACLTHGIRLYHFWYDTDTQENRERVMAFIDAVLKEESISVSPGDKVDRDYYPDPSDAGLPYKELPPEPFETSEGICYNSGYWQF